MPKEERKRVAIVVGTLDDIEFFSLFEALQDEFEITVFVLRRPGLIENYQLSLPIKVFEEVPEMPGFIRSLESNLASWDVILCLDSSRLSSFQAVRAAIKNRIPVVCFINEGELNRYLGYKNIRAIQQEVFSKADQLIVSSEKARSDLILEGVSPKKVEVNPLGSTINNFIYSDKKRMRFRESVGIMPHELLVTIIGDLSDDHHYDQCFFALVKLSRWNRSLAARLKVMLVGNGAAFDHLSYLAYDLGIGKQILFLRQEIDSFAIDLYCASDLIIDLPSENPDTLITYPRWILDAMLCRAVPIAIANSDSDKMLGDRFRRIYLSSDAFFECFKNILLDLPGLAIEGVYCEHYIKENFNNENVAVSWASILRGLLSKRMSSFSNEFEFLDGVEDMLINKCFSNVLDEIKNVENELESMKDVHLSKLLRFRGDAFAGLSRFKLAVEAYQSSIEIDSRNYRSYLGLGEVSLRSKAYDDAILFFRKVLSLRADCSEAYLGIGICYKCTGKLDESIFVLLRSLSLAQSSKRALITLVQIAYELPNTELAIEYLEQAREYVGEESTLMFALGKLYIKEGLNEYGLEAITKAEALLK